MSSTKIVTELVADDKSYGVAIDRAVAKNLKYQKSAKATVDGNKTLSTGFRNAATSVAVIDGPLGGVAGRLTSIGSAISSTNILFAGMAIAMAGVTTVMAKAIAIGDEYERQQLRTEALLKSTGFSAGLTADALEEQARALALSTLASTQGVRDAQAALLTFKSVSGDTFSRTITLAQDLASVMGGDVKSATTQLAKALEDPTTGLTMLRRSGVSFTDSEKDLIISMHNAGNAAEAQGLILDKLQQQVGGAGSAEAGGLSGSVDTLGQRWDELLEALYKSTGAGDLAVSTLNNISKAALNITRDFDIDRILEQSATGSSAGANAVTTELVKPYEIALQQVRASYLDAKQQISEIELSPHIDTPGLQARLQNQQQIYTDSLAQYNRIYDQYVIEPQKQAIEAEKRADRERAQRDQDRIASKQAIADKADTELLTKQQNSSAQLLAAMDVQLSDQSGKIDLNYQKRVDQITALTLSESQIQAAGYDTLSQLQTDYFDKAAADRDIQQAALNKKTGSGGLDKQLDDLRESYASEEQLLLEKTLNEQEILINAQNNKLISQQEAQQLSIESWDQYYAEAAALSQTSADTNVEIERNAAMSMLDNITGSLETSDQLAQTFSNGLSQSLAQACMSGELSFESMANAIINQMLQMMIQAQIVGPMMNAMGLGGTAGGTTPTTTAGVNHTGGIAGIADAGSRSVPISAFAGAPRFHTGGIVGSEVPIIAQRGEGIFTREQMANMSPAGNGGGTKVSIQLINNGTQQEVEKTEQTQSGDTTQIKMWIRDVINGDLNSGQGIDRTLRTQYPSLSRRGYG